MSTGDARWKRVNELFHAAVGRPISERDAFIVAACGDDAALRLEVQSLLAAHQTANTIAAATSLVAGTRLGDYEVTSFLAAGGMGEVYRGRDMKLGRDVALKILPPAFVADPDRRARFDREARLLASLNHPNIATIYGFVEQDGFSALALELVDGETLAERIARGKLPVEEALRMAKQIAEALEAAHEQGIIHRDLKPANIKVTLDGTVKVLDFGLAKLTDSVGSGQSAAASALPPTITAAGMVTGVGILLGTPTYMSPEQARGEAVDRRTDIWAFGCLLYEMLAGRPAFEGTTITEVLASILAREPDFSAIPRTTSLALRQLLRRCLDRDPRRRLQAAAEARVQLEDLLAGRADEPASVTERPHSRLVAAVAALALIATALAGYAVMPRGRSATAVDPVRFTITPNRSQSLFANMRESDESARDRNIAISPDGSFLIYVGGPNNTLGATGAALAVGNRARLILRPLKQLEGHELPGTIGARDPFVSPDGRWVGFFDGPELKKAPVDGGMPTTICRCVSGQPLGASWGADDTITFSTSERATSLRRVSSDGGEPVTIKSAGSTTGEEDYRFPFVLPGGRAVLYTSWPRGGVENAQVAVLDLVSGQRKTLIRGAMQAEYLPTGHLVFASSGGLRAIPFDLSRLQTTGKDVPIVSDVFSVSRGAFNFTVSNTGALVYERPPAEVRGLTSLIWVDRQGHQELIDAPPHAYGQASLSPDDTRAALDIREDDNDVWVWNFARHTLTRLTVDAGINDNPQWTPDGTHIVFRSTRSGSADVYVQKADGTGSAVRLTQHRYSMLTKDVGPDGKSVILQEANPETDQDLQLLTLDPEPRVRPLIQTLASEGDGKISPDGKWLAYVSNESGTNETYVRPFPAVDAGRWQVSTRGGVKPFWSRNGQELFFIDGDGFLTTVPVTASTTFTSAAPRRLFDARTIWNGGGTISVTRDGQRFLIVKVSAGFELPKPDIVVVLQWLDELKRLVPSN